MTDTTCQKDLPLAPERSATELEKRRLEGLLRNVLTELIRLDAEGHRRMDASDEGDCLSKEWLAYFRMVSAWTGEPEIQSDYTEDSEV